MSPYPRDQVAELLALREDLEAARTELAAERNARGELAREVLELRGVHERQGRDLRIVAKWVLPPLGTIALAALTAWLADVRTTSSADGAARVRQETAEADHRLLQDLARDHARLDGRVDAIAANLTIVLGPRWIAPAPSSSPLLPPGATP